MSQKRRITEVDALRGIAAIMVVLYHYTSQYSALFGHEKESYFLDFHFGFLGVQLFFIISGFVIYMSVLKVQSMKEFTIKRMIRLYPAYIVAVILTFTITTLSSLDRLKSSLSEAIINLTMLQGFIPGVDEVDGVYWSLLVEITFYAMMAVLLLIKAEKKVMLFSISLLTISAIVQAINTFYESGILVLVENLMIANYSHLFIIGIMFFLLKDNNQMRYHLVIGACIIYDLVFLGLVSGLATAVFVAVFYLMINGKLKFLNFKPLIFLGAISYPLYLVHQNIGYVIINKMESVGMVNEFFLIVPIVVSIILAYGITKYIESPIQNKLLSSYKRRKESKASPAIKQKVVSG